MTTVAGRYAIEGEIGRGATGIVLRAREVATGRAVALKQLVVTDRLWLQRFQREAQTARLLSHPHILSVYELLADGGKFYLAMEFVDGTSLEDVLKKGKRHSIPEALRMLEQTASALDHAHGKGIVHRDVKPGNLLVRTDGLVKLVDFGVAKGIEAGGSSSTMAGMAVGTPDYMSPEQVDMRALDARSDQFSLAAVAYELLTGVKPFEAEHVQALVAQIVSEDPPTLAEARQVLGAPVDVLMRGLAKTPGERYASCGEFVAALRASAETKTPAAGGGVMGRFKKLWG
jgi:serine/threonine-protein kinase